MSDFKMYKWQLGTKQLLGRSLKFN